MYSRELTCIICPRGCTLKVKLAGEKQVTEVTGNHCKRGKEYAENECTNPQRTVTTTMRCSDGSVIPVKTDKAIPKARMMECMKKINQATVQLPVSIGTVVLEDVFGSNIVVTENR